ncbi:MAG: ligand-binding sensor domain-containing protein [Nitrospira sp.]
MTRHILVLTVLALGCLQGTVRAVSAPSGRANSGTPALEQAHPGADPAGPADIGNTSIQALAAGTGGVVYAGSFGMGIFRSGDRGDTWSSANEGLTDPFVLCLTTAKDGAIYAGTFRGGVFRSRDAGKSWQPINKGLKRLEIKALMMDAKGLYAGTGDGVYLLNAAQDQWKVVTTGLDEILVHALARTNDGTLYAGTSGKGLHSYRERTPGWTRLRQGLRDHEGLVENFIRVLAVDKEQGVYAGTFDGGVFRSGDGGKTWLPISRALPNDSIRGLISNDRGVYVATGRGIFKSVDKGRQWMPLNKGLSNLSIQVLIEGEKGGFYAGTSSGVFRSDDDGLTWTAVSQGLEGESVAPFRFN